MGAAAMNLFLEVKLKGGLGNQLFQYSTGRCLAIKKKIPYLLLNPDSYSNDAFNRSFALSHFNIQGSVLKSGLAKKALREGTKINRFISKLPFYGSIRESGLFVHPFPTRLRAFTSMAGYWQSDRYFSDIRDVLVEEITPVSYPSYPAWMEAKNTVAVHVRRADYLVENRFGSLSERYYTDAMNLTRASCASPVFIFFSDDPEWCKSTFKAADILFFEEEAWAADYLQLFLMSRCRHQIIANSSFSWWSAWLNTHPDRIVIRPETPFRDASLLYESYYPVEWIRGKN
jgi:hypothetical protein